MEVVSEATSISGKFSGYKKRIDELESIKYFSSYGYKNFLLRRLVTLIQWSKILMYLLVHVRKSDKVLVYHSIYNLKWLTLYYRLLGRKYSIEIEDVFSELTSRAQKYKDKEWTVFRNAETCFCVNDLIAEKIKQDKRVIVSYGSYSLPKYKPREASDMIRLVYAGVIEQERNAAFLAVDAMRYLPEKYHLDILGFGSERDIVALQKRIEECDNKNIEFHGRKDGEQYISFLQSCDIGLSTHVYDENNIKSADNTFPSKVLIYLSNGLTVVAQRLNVLEKSRVNEAIVYYDEPTPQNVATTIQNCQQKKNSRFIVEQLNETFLIEVRHWLEEV